MYIYLVHFGQRLFFYHYLVKHLVNYINLCSLMLSNMTLPQWQSLSPELDYRQDFEDRKGHKFQLKYTHSGEIITVNILPNSGLRHGAKDSLTIYDPKNQKSVAIGFLADGSIDSRVETDYVSRQGEVMGTSEIHAGELALIRPLYERKDEALSKLKGKLQYHESAKHKPLAYLSDLVRNS